MKKLLSCFMVLNLQSAFCLTWAIFFSWIFNYKMILGSRNYCFLIFHSSLCLLDISLLLRLWNTYHQHLGIWLAMWVPISVLVKEDGCPKEKWGEKRGQSRTYMFSAIPLLTLTSLFLLGDPSCWPQLLPTFYPSDMPSSSNFFRSASWFRVPC